MAVKVTARTPCCFLNGFPVLRVGSGVRNAVAKIMANNKPESMLYTKVQRK
jgi:hypothetical protein